jgi:hypothetical protein
VLVAACRGRPLNITVSPVVSGFTVMPALNVWSPVQVGTIDCESASVTSLRKNVLAVPFEAASVTLFAGLAPVEVEYPARSVEVATQGTVPVADKPLPTLPDAQFDPA